MFSLDSFVNNTEGQGSNKLIIDGVFSNGAWVSLYGDRSSLIYTNFFKDEALGSENDRVNIRPSSSIHLAEYDWTSQPGLHNTRPFYVGIIRKMSKSQTSKENSCN